MTTDMRAPLGAAADPRSRFRWHVRDDRMVAAPPRVTIAAGRNAGARTVVPPYQLRGSEWAAFVAAAR